MTTRQLEEIGVSVGWSCREVGGGFASIACRLAERIRAGGRVIVIDIDASWLHAEHPNIESPSARAPRIPELRDVNNGRARKDRRRQSALGAKMESETRASTAHSGHVFGMGTLLLGGRLWGSSVFRMGGLGPAWQMHSPVPPPASAGLLPVTKIRGSMLVGAKPFTVSPYSVGEVPGEPVVQVQIPRYARLDPSRDYTDLSDAWFCMQQSCTCPPGATGQVPPTQPLSVNAPLAISGDPSHDKGTYGQVTYYSLPDLCHTKKPPQPPEVSPGFWAGQGHITGGFQTTNGATVTVRLVSGGGFSFCMHVLSGGAIDSPDSSWHIEPSTINYSSQSGASGHADVSGSGDIGGYLGAGARSVEFTGQMHFDVTVHIGAITFSHSYDSAAAGPLDINNVGPKQFSGDLTIANEQAQQSTGLVTNEKGLYVARRVPSC